MTMIEPRVGSMGPADAWLPSDPLTLVAWGSEILARLQVAGPAEVDDEWFGTLAVGVERLSAQVAAAQVAVAAECERRGHFRRHGFFSTKGWVKHRVNTSGPAAHARVQVMRLFELAPLWAAAARAGDVGEAQTVLMARVAANPGVQPLLAEVEASLLDDAVLLPYERFEEQLRNWERVADHDAASDVAQRNHAGRDARMRQRHDGGWDLVARFGSLQGAEINEVLAHLFQAEWESDWAEARDRFGGAAGRGEGVSTSDLVRTEPQRRADALFGAVMTAAGSTGGRAGSTLDVLIDEQTLKCAITGKPQDHTRYRSVVCRTRSGHPVAIEEAAASVLWEHVRRVVHDGAGTVTELGRRRRLFTGAAREAVLLLDTRCWWPGCDRPVGFCQADHAVEWRQHGATVPRNGRPLCATHNRLGYTGRFRSHRDESGEWHLLDRDGNPVD